MRPFGIIKRLLETKVLENYSYMTLLNICSALISILIYPYVIRMVGSEAYGLYVVAYTVAIYLQIAVDFGFDSPCTKLIAQNTDDTAKQSQILSTVTTIKCSLAIATLLLFIPIAFTITLIRDNWLLFGLTALQMLQSILMPTWLFQGLKKMKFVTIINLIARLLTIPFIFFIVRSADQILWYAIINTLSILLGGVAAMIIIRQMGIRIFWVSPKEWIPYIKDAYPFFLTGAVGKLKESTLTAIIAAVFGLSEVAIYDLAQKIVRIPRMFTQNINAALFPEIINNPTPARVKTVLRYERLIGFGLACCVASLGYFAVLLLGGRDMLEAYPLTIILSCSLYTWLVIGCFLNFLFIPAGLYTHITRNQIVAFFSCTLFCGIGLFITHNILVVSIALTLSEFCELLYCHYITHKYQLL